MRVVHVLPNLAIGGRERAVCDLVSALAGQGISNTLITYDPLPTGTAQIACGAEVVAFDRQDRHFRAQLADVLGQGFDLAHAHGHIPAHYLYLGARHLHSLPLMATIHVSMAGNWRWAWQVRRALRAMHGLTAVSQDFAESYGRLAGRPVAVTPNGVSNEWFGPQPPRWPGTDGVFRFAMAARLVSGKRPFDAVAAAELVRANGRQVELHIAGTGPLLGRLQNLAQTRPWLRLHGAIDDMQRWLAMSHGFLLPSVAEGMPLAMLEAMAAGLPAIVSDLAPLRQLGADAALYAPACDPAGLAQQMEALIDNEILWVRMSKAGRSRARHFSLEAAAHDMAARYRQLIASRSACAL